jgi:hypothetical protein
LQWLQDPSQINGDTLNNVRCEASRQFRNNKREYVKDKINELIWNSKKKNITDLYRGINKLRNGYQPRTIFVIDENIDMLTESHVLYRWRKYFSQL